MYPMYGWMDSHPHPRNQMVYAPFHAQSFDSVPPHMKIDPLRPAIFEPWPYGSSYGYSCPPTECHGCCNHNYFPSHYNFRPHYPHSPPPPPPPPHSYHGNYHPFFGGYPGYQIPPTHFSVEQPRYEYDKGFPKDQHCCGCSNHSCKREPDENENVKIKERKTDMDKKSSGSLAPSHLRNFPFPFAMIPPDYLVDTEESKSAKSEGKEDKKINHEMECDENSKSSHEKDTRSQQDIQSQFPFPLFWLPYKPEEVEKDDLKGMNSGQKALITPFDENKDEVKIPSSETGSKMIGDGATQKEIPVKNMERVEEKKKDEERKVKSIPVVQADDNQEKGSTRNSAKKEGSPSKLSKLPPVCLRVDPPKAKKVNGSSRSPSPPAVKGRSRQSLNENSKSLGQNEQSQSEIEKRNIKVIEGTTEGEIKAHTNNHVPPSHEEVPSRKPSVEEVFGVMNQDVGEATESEKAKLKGQSVNKEEAIKVRKKMMSDSEAAVTIQSVYRGYEVRKSEPLKKLRQIAEVTQKMLEVKACISTLDACSDVEIDEKHLVVIGETIMGLLLKLDTIQGLHSSVREIRKSVAKELVNLQEKLDSLATRKAHVPTVPPSSETPEGPSEIVTDNVSVESKQNVVEVVLDGTQVSALDTDAQFGSQMLESDREIELEDQKHQVLDKAETLGEVAGSSSLVESFEKVGEVAGQDKLPQVVLETTEVEGDVGPKDDLILEDIKVDAATENSALDANQLENVDGNQEKEENVGTTEVGDVGPKDDLILEDIKVDAATENSALDANQLENVDGNQEEEENVGQESHLESGEMLVEEALHNDVSQTEKNEVVVSDMEGSKFSPKEDGEVQTEAEISTPVQEKVTAEDHKEADKTQELVPPVMEDRVDDGETKEVFGITDIDGNDKRTHMLSDENLEKKLPMPDNIVDHQSEGPYKVNMEKGEDGGVMEENKRLKEMMEKLIEAGNEQIATITKLSGKVKDLEKKLSKKGKLKSKKSRRKRQDMVLV